MSDMESLLVKKDIDGDRWYPYAVVSYRKEVLQGILSNLPISFASNIAYSLQYLEFLELQLSELKLSSVLWTMVIKSYIVTSASIIEIIFYHIAKEKGKIKKRYWKQLGAVKDKKTIKLTDGTVQKISEFTQIKLSVPVLDTPTFESLISIVRDNRLLNDLDLVVYKRNFKTIRELRNKVHLTIATKSSETDYWSFSPSDYLRVKYFLFKILTDSTIGVSEQPILMRHLNRCNMQIKHYKQEKKLIF